MQDGGRGRGPLVGSGRGLGLQGGGLGVLGVGGQRLGEGVGSAPGTKRGLKRGHGSRGRIYRGLWPACILGQMLLGAGWAQRRGRLAQVL